MHELRICAEVRRHYARSSSQERRAIRLLMAAKGRWLPRRVLDCGVIELRHTLRGAFTSTGPNATRAPVRNGPCTPSQPQLLPGRSFELGPAKSLARFCLTQKPPGSAGIRQNLPPNGSQQLSNATRFPLAGPSNLTRSTGPHVSTIELQFVGPADMAIISVPQPPSVLH